MTQFDVDRSDERTTVVRPRGRLNMVAAPNLSTLVGQLLDEDRARVVVDLSDTQFIDSSGLGALVGCLKKTRQAGGDLRIAAPTEQVSTVLELTNLHRVLRPSPTVDDARARL